jgi:hypothetical protein
MDSIPASGTPYEDLLLTLKTAMDPNDILAPGRYDFRNEGKKIRASLMSRPRFDRNRRLPSERRCQG